MDDALVNGFLPATIKVSIITTIYYTRKYLVYYMENIVNEKSAKSFVVTFRAVLVHG